MTLWAVPRTSRSLPRTTEDRQARGTDRPSRQVGSTRGCCVVSLSRVREAKSPHARLVPALQEEPPQARGADDLGPAKAASPACFLPAAASRQAEPCRWSCPCTGGLLRHPHTLSPTARGIPPGHVQRGPCAPERRPQHRVYRPQRPQSFLTPGERAISIGASRPAPGARKSKVGASHHTTRFAPSPSSPREAFEVR